MKKNHFCLFLIPFFYSFLPAEVIQLPEVITYLDNEFPAVEQRQVFTAEDIDELNVIDAVQLLESAGIQLISYGPYGLDQKPSIRGFTDETVRVIIDGICVNNAQYGTFDFSTLNIDDIEKIEIVRGGFTEGVSDEDAVAGAIYITTKKQEFGTHFKSDSSVKSYFNKDCPLDTFSQKLGFNTNVGNSFIKTNGAFTFANNKYLYKNYNDEIVSRENAKVIDGSGDINFLKYLKNGSSVGVTDLIYAGNKQTPGSSSTKNFGNQKDCNNNLMFQMINPEVANAFKLENNLAWLCNYRTYEDSYGYSEHQIQAIKYNFTQNVYKYRRYKQDLGLSFDFTHLNSTNDGVHNQFSGAFKSTSKFFLQSQNSSVNQKEWLLSFPWAVKFCGNNFAFTPKVGVGVNFLNSSLFFDIYKMTQFPNMDDLYWDDGTYHGNPNLKPENGYGAEISLNQKSKYVPFSICVFSNYYENKIQWAGTSPENVASAFYFGSDINIEKTLLQNKMNLIFNAEYLYTRLLDKSNKVIYGKKIMWTPDLIASLTLNYKPVESTVLSLDMNYTGKRYKSNVNTGYMKPYLLVNLSAQTSINTKKNWKITPYLRGENLFNWTYVSVPDYPMPGISAAAGIKISL